MKKNKIEKLQNAIKSNGSKVESISVSEYLEMRIDLNRCLHQLATWLFILNPDTYDYKCMVNA